MSVGLHVKNELLEIDKKKSNSKKFYIESSYTS
jgi:hypothetical protein